MLLIGQTAHIVLAEGAMLLIGQTAHIVLAEGAMLLIGQTAHIFVTWSRLQALKMFCINEKKTLKNKNLIFQYRGR